MAYEVNYCQTKEQFKHLAEVVTSRQDGDPSGAEIDESTLSYANQTRKTLDKVIDDAYATLAEGQFITPAIEYGSGELVNPDNVDIPNGKYPGNQSVWLEDPASGVTIAYVLKRSVDLPYDLTQAFNHNDWIAVSLRRTIQRNFPAYSDYQKVFQVVESDGVTPIRFIDVQPYYDGRKLTGQKDTGPGSLPPSFTVQRPSPEAPDEVVINGLTIYADKEFWLELTIEEPITSENDMLNFGEVVYVRDYTRAGDANSADGIAQAFQAAKNKTLMFEPGATYNIDGLSGNVTCDNIRVDFNNSTFNITGLTKAQHDAEGDAARGWWYRSKMIHINAENVILLNGVFDGQNSFIDTIIQVVGARVFTNNLEFKNVRYPNSTFANQWPTSTESAFVVADCTKSDVEGIWFKDYLYQLFDDSLVTPNSNAQLQGRCLSLNGRNGTENTQMLVSNVHFERCSMATVSDQTNEVNYSWCTWRNVRANCAYLLSGGIAANFFGGFMTDCDDQGITCYAINLKVIGMSFFNVANRPISLRQTALDRVLIQGCTFRHKEAANHPGMMPIGYPGNLLVSIKNLNVSNNIFDIDVLNYYICQAGNLNGVASFTNNDIRIGRCSSTRGHHIFYHENLNDVYAPTIDGNRIHFDGNEDLWLCRNGQLAIIGKNDITPVTKLDGSGPSVRVPDYSYEIQSGDLNALIGRDANETPKGNFHISCQSEIEQNMRDGFGVWWSASSDSSNYSPHIPFTMGAFGVAWGSELNQDVSENYFAVVMPDPSTRIMKLVGKVTANGDFESAVAGSGVILRTPDGTKKYRLKINNSGNISTELV